MRSPCGSHRVTRFEQEARAASALDHPGVCTIPGLEDTHGGQRYLRTYAGTARLEATGGIGMAKSPLSFTFYIAAPIEKVWDGFVSKEANRIIFMGVDFDIDLVPGGTMSWSGPGKDGKPARYVTGKVLRAEAPKLLEYRFGMGEGTVMSRVTVELTPETEAVKVVVTNDEFAENDPAYAQNAEGWPRILSRLKTLLETGKTFQPH
jgi:uncharacterized protein YndB with AHSA1/START domain